MRFFVFTISLFIVSFSYSQNVKLIGRCVNKKGDGLDSISVYCQKANPSTVYTNSKGFFELIVIVKDSIEVVFAENTELKTSNRYLVPNKDFFKIEDVQLDLSTISEVTVTAERTDPFEITKLPSIDLGKVASTEKYLVYTTAASSNNELTSNYNVRGGSYDENLVYVNGFNINRPFLTRSGQQEGMSFINSALVKEIRFSGGGFDSQYGDKLSSVLDITYKTPDSLKGSVVASIMGAETHIENKIGTRFDYLVGARYRNNGYLLNSLPAKGTYNPIYMDAQVLTNFYVTDNVKWSILGHFSSNRYRFAPVTAQTDFGVANEAYRFVIYFDGKEDTYFQTFTGGTSLKWEVNKKTKLDFYATVFQSDERERYDIQGQYFINLLETDPSKEEYGDSIAVLGIGTFLNHARNQLNSTIINIYHNGEHLFKKGYMDVTQTHFQSQKLMWGVNFQQDQFKDVISEWVMIDSAGYSLPQNTEELTLNQVIKSNLSLQTFRATSFVQMNSTWSRNQRNKVVTLQKMIKTKKKEKSLQTFSDTIRESATRLTLNWGVRGGYTQINNDYYVTPRVSLTYSPRIYMVEKGRIVRREVKYRISTGLYYQPPIYREFRTHQGLLNTSVLSQKSFHFVIGSDVYFNMWNRESPFKFTAEAYYKYLWDVNVFKIDNVRTIYSANNDAVAYAYGLDLNVHGQFVKGIESFFKVGLLSTKQNLNSDYYYDYYNAAGEKIELYKTEDIVAVDSAIVYPGYIPRPTDQWVNFGALIQDKMPGYESLSVQMGVQFGTPLPYGPPNFKTFYKDTMRYKQPYFRVDLGMSYDLLYKKSDKFTKIKKNFTDAIVSFEVTNLLGFYNILSKQWIQDVNGIYYSIPNYLTQRRFNLKLILRF